MNWVVLPNLIGQFEYQEVDYIQPSQPSWGNGYGDLPMKENRIYGVGVWKNIRKKWLGRDFTTYQICSEPIDDFLQVIKLIRTNRHSPSTQDPMLPQIVKVRILLKRLFREKKSCYQWRLTLPNTSRKGYALLEYEDLIE